MVLLGECPRRVARRPKGEDFRFVLRQGSRNCGTIPHLSLDLSPQGWQPSELRVSAFPGVEGLRRSQYWPGTHSGDAGVFLVADFAGQSAPKILFDQEACLGISCAGRRSGGSRTRPSSVPPWCEAGAGRPGMVRPVPWIPDITAGFFRRGGASEGVFWIPPERAAPTPEGRPGAATACPPCSASTTRAAASPDCTEDKTGTPAGTTARHQPLVF